MAKAPTPIRDPRVEDAVHYAATMLPDAADWGLENSRHYWIEFNRAEIQKFWPNDGDIDRVRILFHMEVDVSGAAEALEVAKGQTGQWMYQDYQIFRRSDRVRNKSARQRAQEKRDAAGEAAMKEREELRAAEAAAAEKAAAKPKAPAKSKAKAAPKVAEPEAPAPEASDAEGSEWDLAEE